MPELTVRVRTHDRIVFTVHEQVLIGDCTVIADHFSVIRIQKPSPLRVIVPALQIVQPGLGVVVIPPIPERIERADNLLLNRCRARLGGNRAVAPCVIGIGAYLGSVFRVDGDNVPLQVFLEVVGIEIILFISFVPIL